MAVSKDEILEAISNMTVMEVRLPVALPPVAKPLPRRTSSTWS